jgi:membrane protein required for colicin V production
VNPVDIGVLVLILLSTVMSLGRGLVREAFSLVAFLIGGAVGFAATVFLGPIISPKGLDLFPGGLILFGIGFLIAYISAAFLGSRLSKFIHASPEIGALDRIAGAIFGVLRGIAAAIMMLLLAQAVVSENALPQEVVKAQSYPYLNAATTWIRSVVPGLTDVVGGLIESKPEKPDGRAQ